jgi:hypothetical protein
MPDRSPVKRRIGVVIIGVKAIIPKATVAVWGAVVMNIVIPHYGCIMTVVNINVYITAAVINIDIPGIDIVGAVAGIVVHGIPAPVTGIVVHGFGIATRL